MRGQTVASDLVTFEGRGSGRFEAPDPLSLAEMLPARGPGALGDVHELAFDEIVDYLAELGRHLVLADNPHLQEALAGSAEWADLTAPLMRASFERYRLPRRPRSLRLLGHGAETPVGADPGSTPPTPAGRPDRSPPAPHRGWGPCE